MSEKQSPREAIPLDQRSHTVVKQTAHLPLEDRRRVRLAKRLLDEAVAKAEDQKLPMRRIENIIISFGHDSEGRIVAAGRIDQYGSSQNLKVIETDDERAITDVVPTPEKDA